MNHLNLPDTITDLNVESIKDSAASLSNPASIISPTNLFSILDCASNVSSATIIDDNNDFLKSLH